MKRLFAVLAAAALAAAVVASAAQLTVNGGTIQAGVTSDLSCDNDGVYVAGWGYEKDSNRVHFVTIGGIDGACTGNYLHVSVYDGNDALLSGGTVDSTASPDQKVTLNAAVDATEIEKLQVAIEGSN